jgi:hypothetical protein
MKNMTQKDKTKEELIEEIRLLQKRIADTEQIVLGGVHTLKAS